MQLHDLDYGTSKFSDTGKESQRGHTGPSLPPESPVSPQLMGQDQSHEDGGHLDSASGVFVRAGYARLGLETYELKKTCFLPHTRTQKSHSKAMTGLSPKDTLIHKMEEQTAEAILCHGGLRSKTRPAGTSLSPASPPLSSWCIFHLSHTQSERWGMGSPGERTAFQPTSNSGDLCHTRGALNFIAVFFPPRLGWASDLLGQEAFGRAGDGH